jgi:hypothetical protein
MLALRNVGVAPPAAAPPPPSSSNTRRRQRSKPDWVDGSGVSSRLASMAARAAAASRARSSAAARALAAASRRAVAAARARSAATLCLLRSSAASAQASIVEQKPTKLQPSR